MEIKISDYDRSDVNRLLMALNHREPDRLPHVELWVTSQAVYEYVLERKLDYVIGDAAEGGQSITPEDDVEFARRLGQDAVLCSFNWRPNNVFKLATDGTRHYVDGSVKTMADLDDLEKRGRICTEHKRGETGESDILREAIGKVSNGNASGADRVVSAA